MKKNIVIVILILVVGALSYYSYKQFNANKDLENKLNQSTKQNNTNENQNNNQEQNNNQNINEDSSIYGFAYVYTNDDSYKLVALNSKGNDIILNTGEGRVTFYIKNNRLLFTNRRASFYEPQYVQKTYYIDLNVHPYKAIQLTEGVSLYDYFDFNSNYLFAENSNTDGKKGIKRYDFNTKEEVIFEEGVYPNGIFIANNKVYYSTMDYNDRSNPQEYYYSIDFNGNNKEKLTKEKYDQVIYSVGYKDESNSYDEEYFIKNNKKVTIDDVHLYIDGKIVYTVPDNTSRWIGLTYSEKQNLACFIEATGMEGEDPKYYCYNMDTNTVEEVNENSKTDFRQIIL